jgi:nicotinamidase-related amidase
MTTANSAVSRTALILLDFQPDFMADDGRMPVAVLAYLQS